MEKIGYSVDETVEASGLGRSTIYELIRSGELDSIKVGRRRIVPADALREFIDTKRTASDQVIAQAS
jgi:excisionase family DNA binding protein